MKFIPDNLYRVYNQGNNKQEIFSSDEDYFTFLRMIRKCISPHTDIIAYCLMPNHFHFLIYADDRVNTIIKQGGLLIDPVTNGFRKLLSAMQEFLMIVTIRAVHYFGKKQNITVFLK